MGTPPDRDDEGSWQPSSWQSEWQQPAPERPGPERPGRQAPVHGGWQRAPDGSWVQTGGGSSGKATAALVMGILGLVLALVFGYQSRRDIDGSGGRIGGRGNATAGIVLGWIGIAIMSALLILFGIGLAVGSS